MLDLPTNTFSAYKLQGSLLAIMDLEKCFITSSVKLKNQLKIYFKQAFDLFLDLLCKSGSQLRLWLEEMVIYNKQC